MIRKSSLFYQILLRPLPFSRKLFCLAGDTTPDPGTLPPLGRIETVLVLLSDPGETDMTEMMTLRMTESPETPPGETRLASGTRSMPRRARPNKMARRRTKVLDNLF